MRDEFQFLFWELCSQEFVQFPNRYIQGGFQHTYFFLKFASRMFKEMIHFHFLLTFFKWLI